MKTDSEFKILFRKHAAELLALTGDLGARVLNVGSVEVPGLRQSVDCVMKLEHDGQVYYRHVEFQAEVRANMALRCFGYNTRLIVQLGAPVVTTVIYPFPPGPRGDLAFPVVVAGREVNRWRFDTVRLWKLDARWALETDEPGVMALIPFMRGGRDLPLIAVAARRIEARLPGNVMSDAEQVLLLFAGRYYTVDEVLRVAGGKKIDPVECLARCRGRGAGQGVRRPGARAAPMNAERALPVVQSCSDPAALKRWALLAAKGTDADLLKSLGLD